MFAFFLLVTSFARPACTDMLCLRVFAGLGISPLRPRACGRTHVINPIQEVKAAKT
jgi:hypothetical protein